MKFYLLASNERACTGFRLGGIDGEVVKNANELFKCLSKLSKDPCVGIVLVEDTLADMDKEQFLKFKAQGKPLILVIPSQGSSYSVKKSIESYIGNAIGI